MIKIDSYDNQVRLNRLSKICFKSTEFSKDHWCWSNTHPTVCWIGEIITMVSLISYTFNLIVASAFGHFCPRSRYQVMNKGNPDI